MEKYSAGCRPVMACNNVSKVGPGPAEMKHILLRWNKQVLLAWTACCRAAAEGLWDRGGAVIPGAV